MNVIALYRNYKNFINFWNATIKLNLNQNLLVSVDGLQDLSPISEMFASRSPRWLFRVSQRIQQYESYTNQ